MQGHMDCFITCSREQHRNYTRSTPGQQDVDIDQTTFGPLVYYSFVRGTAAVHHRDVGKRGEIN